MEDCKGIFNSTFGYFKEIDKDPLDQDTLISAYVQYLLYESNASKKEKDFFDYGGLTKNKGKTFVFLWGKKPLVHLETNTKDIEGVIDELNISSFEPSMYPPFAIIEAGAALIKDEKMLLNLMLLRKKLFKEGCNNDKNGCKSQIIKKIIENPKILGFDGAIEIRDNIFTGKPDRVFGRFLYQWLYSSIKTQVISLYGSTEAKINSNYKKSPFGEHDLIFLLELPNQDIKIINLELKFGKNRDPLQVIRQHLFLKEKFGHKSKVFTITFNIYKGYKNILANKLDDITEDNLMNYLSNKHPEWQEEIIECSSDFSLFENNLNAEEIRNELKLKENAQKHLASLKQCISEIVLR